MQKHLVAKLSASPVQYGGLVALRKMTSEGLKMEIQTYAKFIADCQEAAIADIVGCYGNDAAAVVGYEVVERNLRVRLCYSAECHEAEDGYARRATTHDFPLPDQLVRLPIPPWVVADFNRELTAQEMFPAEAVAAAQEQIRRLQAFIQGVES